MISRESIHSHLRDYQSRAVDATFAFWRAGRKNPLIEVPTGGGKSRILAAIAADVVRRGGRVVIATHRSELVDQDAAACELIAGKSNVGVYSDMLGRYETAQPIIVASIQSIAKHTKLLGRRDLLLVDEAHLVGPEPDSQYRVMISELSAGREGFQCAGLTATPYRAGQGMLTQGDEALFTALAYRVTVLELLAAGHLAPLVTPQVEAIHTDQVAQRLGDYVAADLMLADNMAEVTMQAAQDVAVAIAGGRRSALLFGVTVEHARQIAAAVNAAGVVCDVVHGGTPKEDRKRILAAFKAGKIAAIASMGVLTTGFDAPLVDVLAVIRPTTSTSLYVQMAGRGMRTCPGKVDCLYLDYGGNIAEHGPITCVVIKEKRTKRANKDAPKVKVCPGCLLEQLLQARECEGCGHSFAREMAEKLANKRASSLDPMAEGAPRGEAKGPRVRHENVEVGFSLHRKKGAPDSPPTVKVNYSNHFGHLAWEFLGFSEAHEPWKRAQAATWWTSKFDLAVPVDEAEAVALLTARGLQVSAIETQRVGDWEKVRKVEVVTNAV